MTTTLTTPTNLPEEVFGEAGSPWNQERARLEKQALSAAAELMAHTGASAVSGIAGFGVTLSVEVTTING